MVATENMAPPRLSVEGAGIVVGGGVFVVSGLVALLSFWGNDLPIAGPGSVGQFAAIAAGIVAFLAYATGRLWHRQGLTPFEASAVTKVRLALRFGAGSTATVRLSKRRAQRTTSR